MGKIWVLCAVWHKDHSIDYYKNYWGADHIRLQTPGPSNSFDLVVFHDGKIYVPRFEDMMPTCTADEYPEWLKTQPSYPDYETAIVACLMMRGK